MTSLPLSSPHVHSQFCDGRSTAEEMVQAAISRGFVSLGISSHGVQDFDLPYAIKADEEQAYIDEIRRLQGKYAGRIRLWLGTERDERSSADRSRYDYIIGSLHYLGEGEQRFSVDGDPDRLKDGIDKFYQGDGQAMALDYYARLGRYIASYKPHIIGHFDLVLKHSRQGQLFDPDSPALRRAALKALKTAYAGCRLMEVNTGALARGPGGDLYPGPELLDAWRRLGGDVILSSDCHSADKIDFGYEKALAAIREAGYQSVLLLGRNQALFERAPI